MNTIKIHTLILCLAVATATLVSVAARAAEEQPAQATTNAPAVEPASTQPPASVPAVELAPAAAAGQSAVPAPAPDQAPKAAVPGAEQPAGTANTPSEQPPASPVVSSPASSGEKTISLTFRNASLDTVLNYLSEASDFVINIAPDTTVRGTVNVISSHPLSKDEVYDLLSTVLNQNNLAVIRNGRVLTILNKSDSKTNAHLPVYKTVQGDSIPATDEMVTQIIPILHANALQLIKDLQPLLASYTTLTANESANALVLTGTRADVRRVVDIVRALDTSISSISTVRVFPLKYADAKQMADAVNQLFQAPATSAGNINRGFRGGRGGGGGGNPFAAMFGGGNQDPSLGTGDNPARQMASKVTAIGDDRTNSLIISAPEEYLPTIEQLVKDVDVSITDLTELRVFHLINADPQETVDELTALFPDPSKTGQNNPQQFAFRGGRGGRGGGFGAQASTQSTPSDRMKKMGQVITVADLRTSSVIVSAASDLMPQIADIIAELDANAAKRQQVYVYSLQNAEPDDVLPVLQDMFNKTTSQRSNRSGTRQGNTALTTRTANTTQQQGRGTTGTGGGRGTTGGIGTGTGF